MKKKSIRNILFLDIETATNTPTYDDLSEPMQRQWRKKAYKINNVAYIKTDEVREEYLASAAIFAEFNKIICISVGYLDDQGDKYTLKIKSFAGDDETKVLEGFCKLLDKHFDNPDKHFLCGHNIKEFDCPVICRRLTIHGMSLPKLLRIRGKKPWQVGHLLDTLQMWKFGDYKSYVSLELLATALGFDSPKSDIDGSMVSILYWEENRLDDIVTYCQKDVVATVQVFLKLIQQKQFEQVKYIA